MAPDDAQAAAARAVAAFEAGLRSPYPDAAELRLLADALVATREPDVVDALADAHPVTQAMIWSARHGLGAHESIQVIVAAATDPEGRAYARSALLVARVPEVDELVRFWQIDVGADPSLRSPAEHLAHLGGFMELDPRIPWDPDAFSSMAQVPDALRPIFPLEDLPAYQHYCSLMGTFEFAANELDMIELIRSAGHTDIVFDGEPISVADAGAQVAFNEWAVSAEEYRHAEAQGDHALLAAAGDRLSQAITLFADSVRDGASLEVGLALDHPEDFANLYATFSDALMVVSAEGSHAQLAQAVREAKVLLSAGTPAGLKPAAVASYDQLRAQVDLLHTMATARNEPEDPSGPGAVGR